MKLSLSLKTKSVAVVLLALVSSALAVTVAGYMLSIEALTDQALVNTRLISELSAEETENLISVYTRLSEAVSHQEQIHDYLTGANSNSKETLEALWAYDIHPGITAIYILDPTGTTLVSTTASFTGEDYSFRPYFKNAIAGEPYIDIAIGATSGQLGYYFATPVKDYNNIIGVAVVKVDPQTIHSNLSVTEQIYGSALRFFDSNGVIVSSNDPSELYKSLGSINEETAGLLETAYPGIGFVSLGYDELMASLPETSTADVYAIKGPEDSRDKIVGVAKVLNSPLYLMIENDAPAFFSDGQDSLANSFGLAFIVLVLIGAVSVWALSRLLYPLGELTKAADQISHGNYDYTINIKRNDELGEIGKLLNVVIDQLKDTQILADQKVKKETEQLKAQIQELEEYNKALVNSASKAEN